MVPLLHAEEQDSKHGHGILEIPRLAATGLSAGFATYQSWVNQLAGLSFTFVPGKWGGDVAYMAVLWVVGNGRMGST